MTDPNLNVDIQKFIIKANHHCRRERERARGCLAAPQWFTDSQAKMNGEVLEIPGYYYGIAAALCFFYVRALTWKRADKEKKKYFKVQASSTAPPTSSYSSQDVKRRKTRDERAEARALGMVRRKGCIQRSKVLEAPSAGGFLAREHGQGGLDGAQVFVGGLAPQGYIPSMLQFSSCSDPLFTMDHRPDLGPSMVDLRIGKSYHPRQ